MEEGRTVAAMGILAQGAYRAREVAKRPQRTVNREKRSRTKNPGQNDVFEHLRR